MITAKDLFKRITKDVFGVWNIANDKDKPVEVGRTFFNDQKDKDIPFNSKNNNKLLAIYRYAFEHKMYLSARDISKNLNMVLKDIFSCDFSYLIFDDYDEPEVDEDKCRYWLLIIEALLDSVVNKDQFEPDKQIFSTTDISARRKLNIQNDIPIIEQNDNEDDEYLGDILFFLESPIWDADEDDFIKMYKYISIYKDQLEDFPLIETTFRREFGSDIERTDLLIWSSLKEQKKVIPLYENEGRASGYNIEQAKKILQMDSKGLIICGNITLYEQLSDIFPNIKPVVVITSDKKDFDETLQIFDKYTENGKEVVWNCEDYSPIDNPEFLPDRLSDYIKALNLFTNSDNFCCIKWDYDPLGTINNGPYLTGALDMYISGQGEVFFNQGDILTLISMCNDLVRAMSGEKDFISSEYDPDDYDDYGDIVPSKQK